MYLDIPVEPYFLFMMVHKAESDGWLNTTWLGMSKEVPMLPTDMLASGEVGVCFGTSGLGLRI